MIEIFKTNVQETAESNKIALRLLEHFPLGKITFDLGDCDKILRVEHRSICSETIKSVLEDFGYCCEVLE